MIDEDINKYWRKSERHLCIDVVIFSFSFLFLYFFYWSVTRGNSVILELTIR